MYEEGAVDGQCGGFVQGRRVVHQGEAREMEELFWIPEGDDLDSGLKEDRRGTFSVGMRDYTRRMEIVDCRRN